MEKIDRDNEPLTDTEKEVKERFFYDPRESLYTRLDLEESLKFLTDKQRRCFELVVMEGRTQLEVAVQLGISQQAVDKLIAKAKEKLRRGLLNLKKVPNTYGEVKNVEDRESSYR